MDRSFSKTNQRWESLLKLFLSEDWYKKGFLWLKEARERAGNFTSLSLVSGIGSSPSENLDQTVNLYFFHCCVCWTVCEFRDITSYLYVMASCPLTLMLDSWCWMLRSKIEGWWSPMDRSCWKKLRKLCDTVDCFYECEWSKKLLFSLGRDGRCEYLTGKGFLLVTGMY